MNCLSLQALYPADYHATAEPRYMTQRIAPFSQFDPSLLTEVQKREADWRVQRGYPGGVSGSYCVRPFASRLSQLSPETQKEVVNRAIAWGVERGISDFMTRAARGMGAFSQSDLENAVARGVQGTVGQLIPNLTSGILDQVTASAKQATSDIIEEKLQKWGFPLAVAVGVVAAVLSVLGMVLVGGYLMKKLG